MFCMTQKGKTKTNGCILTADGFQFDVKNHFLMAEVVKGQVKFPAPIQEPFPQDGGHEANISWSCSPTMWRSL